MIGEAVDKGHNPLIPLSSQQPVPLSKRSSAYQWPRARKKFSFPQPEVLSLFWERVWECVLFMCGFMHSTVY